jgi:hypothetical protein
MTQGLQCFDPNGNIIVDVTDHLTKTLGSFTTTPGNGKVASGSVVDDRLLLGTPWFVATGGFNYSSAMAISVSGNTLNWEFSYWYTTDGNTTLKIIYGVF